MLLILGGTHMHIHTSKQKKLKLGIGDYTCNWGTHIAGLYETPEERNEILLGYLHEGIIDNDAMMYCLCEQTETDFRSNYQATFHENIPSTDECDCINFLSAKDLYYPDGTFSPKAMDEGLNAYYRETQKSGARNIRATAEMVWALEAIPGIEHLMVYESRLNLFILDKPWISICLYNTSKFSGSTIIKVLQTHPYTISAGVITENPYYQNPDQWLSENAPQFLIN
jgi:hypothetical protein